MSDGGVRTEEYYEAVTDDGAYARLPDLLARAGSARSAILVWCHGTVLPSASTFNHFSPEMMQAYALSWVDQDPWFRYAGRSGRYNEPVLMENHIPASSYSRSPFFNDFIQSHGDNTFFCIGGVIRSHWGHGVISVQRGRSQAPFEESQLQSFSSAFKHSEIVFRLRGELAAARAELNQARSLNDSLSVGIIAVRGDGQVLEINAAADTVLARGDGLIQRNGRLKTCSPEDQCRLDSALRQATAKQNPEAATILIRRSAGAGHYFVTATPSPGSGGMAQAILVFKDPDAAGRLQLSQLQDLFGLTRAEAAVMLEIADGRSPQQISQRRGVRVSTIRAQLRAIGAKTGLSRQPELTRLVHALPPLR